jgi:hypothetical protein
MKTCYALLTITFLTLTCQARTIYVDDDGPADFNNIQAAINDANNGDEVVVADGVYTGSGNRDIDFNGLAITVRSENGASCIIDVNGTEAEPHRGFIFQNGEDSNSVLKGFTISNGFSDYWQDGGSAVAAFGSTPLVTDCVFTEHNGFSVVLIEYMSGDPPSLYSEISNCTFTDNDTDNVICGIGCGPEYLVVKNSIIWANSGYQYERGHCKVGAFGIDTSYSILQSDWIYDGSHDNQVADPCFVDPGVSGCRISWDSPCINAGDPGYITGPNDIDMDGEPRVIGNRVDMGADEVDPNGIYIHMSPLTLLFGAGEGGPNPDNQTLSVHVYSPNGITLDWQIIEDCTWLTIEPNSGTWTGEPNEVTVSVDITGLSNDIYRCSLQVEGPNAIGQTTQVTLDVLPRIELSNTEYNFEAYEGGANPANQTLGISNSGLGTLNWQINYDCNWLTIDPTGGSSTGETDDVDLSVDITGLSQGSYNCELTVIDPNAKNNPQTVSVNLHVIHVIGPVIALSETDFNFEAYEGGINPDNQTLGISNSGVGTLNWQINHDCNWLTVDPNSGSSAGG